MFSCSVPSCGYQTSNKYDLHKHQLYHDKAKHYACPRCRQLFTTSSDLRRHERTHSGAATYQCSFENCSFATRRSDTLRLHERTHTSIETRKKFPCPSCGKLFSSHQITTRHLRKCAAKTSDAGNGTQCDVCQKVFSSRSKLVIHKRIHDGTGFRCHVCDKMLPSNYGLNKHLMTHEKSFECKHCNKKFSRKDNLESHTRSNHEHATNIIVDYICSFCQTTFASSDDLLKHFEASTVCNEGCQEHALYQEVVECAGFGESSSASKLPSTIPSQSGPNIVIVKNFTQPQILLLEEPVVIFKQ